MQCAGNMTVEVVLLAADINNQQIVMLGNSLL